MLPTSQDSEGDGRENTSCKALGTAVWHRRSEQKMYDYHFFLSTKPS